MGARRKLNQLYATGPLIVAGFVGLVFQSWWAFAGSLVGGPRAASVVARTSACPAGEPGGRDPRPVSPAGVSLAVSR